MDGLTDDGSPEFSPRGIPLSFAKGATSAGECHPWRHTTNIVCSSLSSFLRTLPRLIAPVEMTMLQLVYVSTARERPSGGGLQAILDISRCNNARNGITGLLVTGGRRFLQALEGPDKAVLDTYARISADPRHFGLVLLSMGIVGERQFGDWSMAFHAGGPGTEGGNLRDTVAALTAGLSDKNLRAQFAGFAALHARAA